MVFRNDKTIHKPQFGFQTGKSTGHAIFDNHASISKVLEKKGKGFWIFSVFAKAFDTINDETLLTKLKYYVVRSSAHKLMKRLGFGLSLRTSLIAR